RSRRAASSSSPEPLACSASTASRTVSTPPAPRSTPATRPSLRPPPSPPTAALALAGALGRHGAGVLLTLRLPEQASFAVPTLRIEPGLAVVVARGLVFAHLDLLDRRAPTPSAR